MLTPQLPPPTLDANPKSAPTCRADGSSMCHGPAARASGGCWWSTPEKKVKLFANYLQIVWRARIVFKQFESSHKVIANSLESTYSFQTV